MKQQFTMNQTIECLKTLPLTETQIERTYKIINDIITGYDDVDLVFHDAYEDDEYITLVFLDEMTELLGTFNPSDLARLDLTELSEDEYQSILEAMRINIS